jgi:hypothetical protein
MNPDTQDMACAVCMTPLNVLDGQYLHPAYSDSDGHQPVPVPTTSLHTIDRACDFCGDLKPLWTYTGGEQVLQVVSSRSQTLNGYSAPWSACIACAADIEAGRYQEPARRAARRLGRFDEIVWVTAASMHTAFFTDLQPGRTLTTTTPWPPARLTAEMLPKVRDRLAGLLRGPADLPTPINDPGQRQALAARLDLIPMYWINHEYTAQVQAVTVEQPTAWINDELAPSDAGLLVWPEPVGLTRQLAAVSWTPQADGWHFIGYRSIGAGTDIDQDLMPTLRHEVGWLVPIHAEHIARGTGINGEHLLGPLATTWLFIHQRMTETVAAKPDKSTAKAYARAKRPAPDIRIVQIRPRPAEPQQHAQTAAGRTRAKPDHRFWVSGHERNQAYGPGRSLRQKIEIQPFLKGDEELPIKLSTTVRVLGRRTEDDRALGTSDD